MNDGPRGGLLLTNKNEKIWFLFVYICFHLFLNGLVQ